MNGKNMLVGLSYIDRKYVEESENDTIGSMESCCPEGSESTRNRSSRKTNKVRRLSKLYLIAAIIAALLALAGCAMAIHYVWAE
ncbi:MAG: hypothetical protein ACI3V0_02015, partial [Faecousia sp.]